MHIIRVIRLFCLYKLIILTLNFKYIVTLTEKYPHLLTISFKVLMFSIRFFLFYKNKVVKR